MNRNEDLTKQDHIAQLRRIVLYIETDETGFWTRHLIFVADGLNKNPAANIKTMSPFVKYLLAQQWLKELENAN